MNKFCLNISPYISVVVLSSFVGGAMAAAAPSINSGSYNLNYRLLKALKLTQDPMIQTNGATTSLVVASQSIECSDHPNQETDCIFTGTSDLGDSETNSPFAESLFKAIETLALATQATDGGVRRLQVTSSSVVVTLTESDGMDLPDLFSDEPHDKITCNSLVLVASNTPNYSCTLDVTENGASSEATAVYGTLRQDKAFGAVIAADIQVLTGAEHLSLKSVDMVKSFGPALTVTAFFAGHGTNHEGRDLVLKAWRNADGTLSVNTIAIDVNNRFLQHHQLTPGVSGNN